MENFKDIESLLTPRVEAKASDNLRARIADIEPQKRHNRRWAVAASIAILFCLSAAAFYNFMPKTAPEETTGETTVVLPDDTPAKPDFFVFDNVEMEQVAATLGEHYKLKPVFENESVKKLRIYLKVDKSKTIQEVVEQLNELDEFTASVSDGKLIIK